MKSQTFNDLIWASIFRSWGPVITILSFGLIFVGYFFTPAEDTIKLKWFLIFSCVSFLLLVIFARVAWIAYSNQRVHLPKVIYVMEPPKAYESAFALFLLEPTSLLSYDTIVSIYYLENEVERLLGIGIVINVQDNAKVQILIPQNYDFGDRAEAIMKNSKDELNRLIVKPSVPSQYLAGGYQ